MTDNHIIDLTADIVSAHVSNNAVAPADLPGLIQSIFTALSNAETPTKVEAPKQEPAVSVRSSVKNDYIVCLEDGAKLKMLKRYLMTNYQMTPDDYRAKWGLPKDYPMVAPAYAEQRRTLAQKIGLGRKKAVDVVAPIAKAVKPIAKAVKPVAKAAKVTTKKAASAVEDTGAPAPKKRGRPAKVVAPVTDTAEA